MGDMPILDFPPLPAGMRYTQVSTSQRFAALLRSDGALYHCDEGLWKIVAHDVVQVSIGPRHTVYVHIDGTVRVVGVNLDIDVLEKQEPS